MKKILFLSILIVFFTTSFISFLGCENQTPTKEKPFVSQKEQYELKEICRKSSEEWFKNNFGNGIANSERMFGVITYQNHYNKKMNQCFTMISMSVTNHREGDKKTEEKYLYDINENKQIGGMSSGKDEISCLVSGKECKSKEEWDSLVKPYMEE